MAGDGLTELALLFKNRDVKTPPSITTGIVLSPLPEIVIRLNDIVTLDKENIIVGEQIYVNYEHQNPLRWLNAGDEVILMPVMDGQLYFMIDKARRLT